MYKIEKIEVAAQDNTTGAIVKLIHTTVEEPFHSKRCAYNQTFERLEKTMMQNGLKSFEKAAPITIQTLRYLGKKNIKSNLLSIKELTASRLSEDSEEKKLFLNEVERLKKNSLTNKRVVIYYIQITKEEWTIYSLEDLKTVVELQRLAKIPHVTIPAHPFKTFDENREFFEKQKSAIDKGQNIFGEFSPYMKKKEGKKLLDKYFMEDKIIGILMTGLTPSPSNTSNLYYYSYCFNEAPKGKLMCAADIQDVFGTKEQRLATHLAFRRFGFDITCRKVTFNLTGFNFPAPPESTFIYDDTTGGMLAENEQLMWHGKSVTDFILENFPAHTGLSFREYVMAFNFIELNRTGLRESHSIYERSHPSYIGDRVYLQSFYESTQEV